MAAFTNSPLAPRKHKMGKYDDYDISSLTGEQNTAPAAQQPASQGALSGGAPAGAAPVSGALGEGEARRPEGPANDFYSVFKGGSDDDREAMTRNVLEPLEAKGVSAEGAAKMMWEKNPQLAAEVGAKFGIVPPADKAGMPGFKTQEQALLDYESDQQKAADEKAKLKKEKRHAMGGFLFEMGLRILASNRQDAGGAIGEGALGTFEAMRQRGKTAREEKIAAEDRKYQLGERGEAATDRTRKREAEDLGTEYAKTEEGRRAAKAKREQEVHEAKKKAGTLAAGPRGSSQSVAQWEFNLFKTANSDKDWNEQQMAEEYRTSKDKLKPGERERLVANYIKQIDEQQSDPLVEDDQLIEGWAQMKAPAKRKWVLDMMGVGADSEEVSFSDLK